MDGDALEVLISPMAAGYSPRPYFRGRIKLGGSVILVFGSHLDCDVIITREDYAGIGEKQFQLEITNQGDRYTAKARALDPNGYTIWHTRNDNTTVRRWDMDDDDAEVKDNDIIGLFKDKDGAQRIQPQLDFCRDCRFIVHLSKNWSAPWPLDHIFELGEELEANGPAVIGDLFKAYPVHFPSGDRAPGQEVVIRIIELAEIKVPMRRAELESLIRSELAALTVLCEDNPHIQRVMATFLTEERITVIMEYQNMSLEDELKDSTAAHESETTANLVVQVTAGLVFLHEKHGIHRDIKPRNLHALAVPTPGGQWKTTWKIGGLRRGRFMPTDTQGASLTIFNSPRADTTYFHPLMVRGDGRYGTEVDYWGLGVITFRHFTGGFPFPDRARLVDVRDDSEWINARQPAQLSAAINQGLLNRRREFGVDENEYAIRTIIKRLLGTNDDGGQLMDGVSIVRALHDNKWLRETPNPLRDPAVRKFVDGSR